MTDNTLNLESNVRSYSRTIPTVFDSANGSWILDQTGNKHLDFLSGCGSLNYGHNHPVLKSALTSYMKRDGLCMSLDFQSIIRSKFLKQFNDAILKPRGLDYCLQFPGPTGANCVEAAIKLARKVTGRTNVIAFTNGFHGCSLGALSLTGSQHHRNTSIPLLNQVTRMPYQGYMGDGIDTAEYLDKTLCDPSSGVDSPAAIIIETVQGEGGLQAASREWMQSIVKIAHQHGALLIIDDIQAGCGRTGNFFSFETLDVTPDMVCMAKSISGYGLPMSLLLIRPELDIWEPGEHNGTFRGNNFAFVTAIAALETFWTLSDFKNKLQHLCTGIAKKTHELAETYGVTVKGRGAMIGLEFNEPNQAKAVQQDCIRQGLIIELCGPHDEVLKFLPPLTISAEELDMGFQFIDQALKNQCSVQMEAVHSRIPLMKTAKGSSVARNRQSPPP